MTLPFAPLSLPAITSTVSPFLIFMSHHLRGERDDLHEPLVTQRAPPLTADAGPPRLAVVIDELGGVLAEPDVGPVRTPALLHGAHDDGLDDVTALHAPTGDGVLHR